MGSCTIYAPRRDRTCRRKGAIIPLVAVAIIILLAAAAFSVDVAYMFLVREELHITTDAAGKAAATALSQGNSQQTAINTAIAYAAANTVGGKPLTIDASNVQFGSVAYSPSGYWTFTPGGTPTTAVQVSVNMADGTAPGSVPLLFGRLFGVSQYNPRSTSIAAFVKNKVCLCFDRSGSMCYDLSGVDGQYPPKNSWTPSLKSWQDPAKYPPAPRNSRWASLTAANTIYLDALNSAIVQTPVALVTWSDSATTNATFTTANNYSTVRNAITSLGNNTMNGYTNMSGGLQQAVNLFASTDDGMPWNKIIILFSDGQWNRGSDPLTVAQQAADAGIVIHTVGLLNSGDNGTLRNIATATGGKYYYAPDGASLQSAFEDLARNLPVILTQ